MSDLSVLGSTLCARPKINILIYPQALRIFPESIEIKQGEYGH